MFEGLSFLPWVTGFLLIGSSLGTIISPKPVHSSLYFFFSLIMLAVLYLELSAEFIAVMQVLVYAGAILVLFVFVIVLFQDAHQQIAREKAKSPRWLMIMGVSFSTVAMIFFAGQLRNINAHSRPLAESFGQVESLGRMLFVDFFLPFEAVVVVFLIAIVGAVYIGKKVE